MSPSHSTDLRIPEGSCRLPDRRPDAVRPVTVRQLIQTEIKKELARSGPPKLRYRLGDNEFYAVDPVPSSRSFPTELISFSQATFVGHIIDVVVSSETTRTIRIDDGTGKITSMYKIIKDQEEEDPPRWR